MEYEPVFERCRISSEVWLYKKRVDDVTTLKDQRIVDLWWCWCVEILANKKKKKKNWSIYTVKKTNRNKNDLHDLWSLLHVLRSRDGHIVLIFERLLNYTEVDSLCDDMLVW